MGAYLSEPITKKISSDDSNDGLSYGASSMQGWRVDQEDAHNTILDFDKNTALFAVYDGHGGHEVSAYAADKLPDFIKSLESYKNGSFSQALIDSFLGFDLSLIESDVLEILNTLKLGDTKEDEAGSESEGEEVDNLCREASMPLEEVIARYEKNEKFQSPSLRAKRSLDEGCSSSSSSDIKVDPIDFEGGDESENKETKVKTDETNSESEVKNKETNSKSEVKDEEISSIKADSEIKSNDNDEVKVNGNTKTENSESKVKKNELEHRINGDIIETESETKKISDQENHKNSCENSDETDTEKINENGDIPKSELNGTSDEPKGKGKGKNIKGKGKAVITKAEIINTSPQINRDKKRQAAVKAESIYRQIQEGCDLEELSDEEDSDTESEDLTTKEVDDDQEEVEDDDEEDDDDDDDEDEDDSDDDDDDEEEDMTDANSEFLNMKEKPGFDSGCTACLALLHGTELYVANVGDSRAVVCRKGEALDMSLDHKPEDEPELQRIKKAGGRVTSDGRVNSGLNLSRALGDHGYKQNKSLPPEDQMISPLPDVKTLTLTEDDSFMIVACDGIWNSMSSQEACDFVQKRINMKLSEICEEMFEFCLAPNILGDGTGCDNMTCIIVKFNNISILDIGSSKRSAVSSCDDDTPNQKKIKCSEN